MNETNFQDIYTLQIRRQTSSNPSPYCEACKSGIVHVNSLQVRQFTQSGRLPGVCKQCNEAFLKICRLQIRHLTQPDSHPHVCKLCNKTFTHAGNIKKHMLLHEKNPEAFLPNATPGESVSTVSVTANKLPVKQQPPYFCEHCERKFVKYGSFQKHQKNHTSVPISPVVYDGNITENSKPEEEENNCEEVTVNSINNDQNSEKTYNCDQCNKSFHKYGFLLRHIQIHEQDSFECNICKKVFKTKPLLSSHMRMHKQHICKLCKESFTVPEELEIHLQNHVQPPPFAANPEKKKNHYCTICNKGFIALISLKNHYRRHETGFQGFQCAKCSEQFVNKTTYKLHLKVCGKSSLKCEVCKKRFYFRRTWKKHLLTHKTDNTLQNHQDS